LIGVNGLPVTVMADPRFEFQLLHFRKSGCR